MNSPERNSSQREIKTAKMEQAAGARLEELKNQERHYEHNPENKKEQIEQAIEEARQEALSSKEQQVNRDTLHEEEERYITPAQKRIRYKKTMHSIQQEMSPSQRAFSAFIHNPVVERASEVVGSTIARPNSILFGAIFALLAVMGLYALAKRIGFALSGFETIGAFILGWIFGLGVDALRFLLKGRR